MSSRSLAFSLFIFSLLGLYLSCVQELHAAPAPAIINQGETRKAYPVSVIIPQSQLTTYGQAYQYSLPDSTNLSMYDQLTVQFNVEELQKSGRVIISLQDVFGYRWLSGEYKLGSTDLDINSKGFSIGLTDENFGPAPDQVQQSSLSFKDIQSVSIQIFSDEKIPLKQLVLAGRQLYIESEPVNLAPQGVLDSATVSESVLQPLADGDSNAPTLSNLNFDGKVIAAHDFVSSRPAITFTLQDDASGVGVWQVQVKDEADTVVQTINGDELEIATADIDLNTSLTPLDDGQYTLSITATDGNTNTLQESSPVFQVKTEFKLNNIVVGPNPYNPNEGACNIQFQLSQPGGVNLYLYTISGEQIWEKQIGSATIGFNTVLWDGHNTHNEMVANGPYILYLKAQKGDVVQVEKKKILVLK